MNGPFLQREVQSTPFLPRSGFKRILNISHLEKADNNILVQRSCDGAKNEMDLTSVRNLFVT